VATPRIRRLSVPVATLALALATGLALVLPGVAAAGPLGQGGGPPRGGPPRGGQTGAHPKPADTPELGSLVLFGSGAAALGGYALARARRRRPPAQ
jgi:hypothetical protein